MSKGFWVLERSNIPWGANPAGILLYYTLRPGVSLDTRIEYALQFAREQDAHSFHHKHLAADASYSVVEHSMVAPSPAMDEAGLREDFAKALALREYPGTQWPRHEDDTIDERQGRYPVRWRYAEICRDLAKFAIDFLSHRLVTVDDAADKLLARAADALNASQREDHMALGEIITKFRRDQAISGNGGK